MRAKKEIIKLDAVVTDVLKLSVCVCELKNGHRLVAVAGGRGRTGVGWAPDLRVGDCVVVTVYPGDMARGRIEGEASK